MSLKKKYLDDEIDLIESFILIWKNKLKVFIFILIGLAIMYINIFSQKSTFDITTEVKSIQDYKEIYFETYNSYILKLNGVVRDQKNTKITQDDLGQLKSEDSIPLSLDFKRIDKEYLYNLFIDKLNEGKIFEQIIKDFNKIKKEDYDNTDEYNEAIRSASSSIILLPPIVDKSRQINKSNWRIQFRTKNKIEAKQFLKEVEVKTNEAIRIYIIETFKKLIDGEQKINQYMVEDFDLKIKNSIDNYDRYIENRILYLKEQSAIARKLDIAKNTLTVQNFITGTQVITEPKNELPYYTNGYEMIEKEIELIKSRTNKTAFISELNGFELKKNNIISNKSLKRLDELFNEIAILKSDNFSAANVMYHSSEYSTNRFNDTQKLIIAAIIAAIFGSIYVLIANAIKMRELN